MLGGGGSGDKEKMGKLGLTEHVGCFYGEYGPPCMIDEANVMNDSKVWWFGFVDREDAVCSN